MPLGTAAMRSGTKAAAGSPRPSREPSATARPGRRGGDAGRRVTVKPGNAPDGPVPALRRPRRNAASVAHAAAVTTDSCAHAARDGEGSAAQCRSSTMYKTI